LADSIEVIGEPIGMIVLEKDAENQWTESERNLVRIISTQIGRQVDNLRLLAQTEQFRLQAEEAVRRLTREGWDEYLQNVGSENPIFTYNHLEILPSAPEHSLGNTPLMNKSIKVRGEPIGELVIEGAVIDDEDSLGLIQTIMDRLTAHIENLRLTTQTQKALKETETLYEIISKLNSAQDYHEILDVLIENTIFSDADQFVLMGVYDKAQDEQTRPRWCIPAAYRTFGDIQIEKRYSYDQLIAPFLYFEPDQPFVLRDIGVDINFEQILKATTTEHLRVRSVIWTPLILGSATIGFVMAFYQDNVGCSESDLQRINILSGQVAIAVQSQLLLDRARTKAQQEQNIREVTAQVFSATDVHTIMKRTVEQVGRVLGSSAFIYLSDRQGPHNKEEA
jgi:GAF domain-containing protein